MAVPEFAVLRGGLGEGVDLVGGEFFGVLSCEGDEMGDWMSIWWERSV